MKSPIFLARLIIAFLLIILVAIGIYAAPEFLLVEKIQGFLREYKSQTYPVYFVLQFFQGISLFIPLTPLTIAGSAILGPIPCFFLTWFALIASQMTNYGMSRALGREFVKKEIKNLEIDISKNRIPQIFDKYGYLGLYILYFSSIASFDLIAYLLGLTKINPIRMLLLAGVGIIPKIAFLCFLGDYFISGKQELIVLIFSITILGIVILSSLIFLRKGFQ